MQPNDYKEVYFDQYCSKCEYNNETETGEHCKECLNNPVNNFSHKPVNFKED